MKMYLVNGEIAFYAQGPSTPMYGAIGNMYCSAGFNYHLKNMKRGWTSIWYGQTRGSNNSGYYHSSYNGFTTFSHSDYSVNVNRTYNAHTWTEEWNSDPIGAQLWASSIFSNVWAYVAGTVSYDVCGPRTFYY